MDDPILLVEDVASGGQAVFGIGLHVDLRGDDLGAARRGEVHADISQGEVNCP